MTETPLTPASAPKALAVISLVVGIIALLTVFFGWVAIAAGLIAVVLGIVALRRRQPKGLAVTGIVTGGIGLVGGIVVLAVAAALVAMLSSTAVVLDGFEPGDPEVILEELDATVD